MSLPLTGTYSRSLDEQHRLAIPKPLRDQFGEEVLSSLYVAPGTERSLSVYSPTAFEQLADKLAGQGGNRAEVRNYLRLFYARAERVSLDGQGRMRIPERLMELAGLNKDVVLLGVHDHAEIWNSEEWNAFLTRHAAEFDEMATRAFE